MSDGVSSKNAREPNNKAIIKYSSVSLLIPCRESKNHWMRFNEDIGSKMLISLQRQLIVYSVIIYSVSLCETMHSQTHTTG